MLDQTHPNHTYLRSFLDALTVRSGTSRTDLFLNEVIETGGTWMAPAEQPAEWASHLVEVSLHGISAIGDTTEQAIANWMRIAERVLSGAIPFTTPRNHAEEIANAVAMEGIAR